MIPLLIGIVCVLAARRALDPDADVLPGRWVAVIGGLVLLQLWLGRGDIARYRVTLLGLRFAVTDASGAPLKTGIRVGGDYDAADLFIPGAGGGAVATLQPLGDSTLESVSAVAAEDASAVLAVEERGRFRRDWRILGASPLPPGDTVTVRGGGRVYRLVVRESSDALRVAGVRIPLPWTRIHTVEDTESGGHAALPAVRGHIGRRIRGAKPSAFARAYPLADIIAAVDSGALALPALGSFLFYERGQLRLADLDSEVERAASAHLPVWDAKRGASRVLVAALPLRDYPEPDLTLPERYGVRPLRTMRLSVRGPWLDAAFASPEVQAFDRAQLAALRLPAAGAAERVYRVRVSHARNSMVREAIVFDAPPRSFAAVSQAILALPENPRAGAFDVVTPSGSVRWETGRPLPLGSAERALLMRVDGQSTSWGFWLAHIGLLALVAVMLRLTRARGTTLALAVIALGFGAVRLLLGVPAMLEYPFVTEAHQIGLWLLPVLPWLVVVAGDIGRRLRGDQAARQWRVHAASALVLVVLALVLFPDSRAKQAVLAFVPVAALAAWGVAGSSDVRALGQRIRLLRWPGTILSGVLLGGALLAGRILLDLIGWREGIQLGGTRIAVSVLYTPAALVAFALLLRRLDTGIRDAAAADGARVARLIARALISAMAFLVLAFVATAVWISDFGIALATLPGALVVFTLVAMRWAGRSPHGRAVALAAALPLLLFALVQAAPGVLRGVMPADVGRSEARLNEWNRNELLLLERGDPASLRMIGQRRSEALAVMRETMRSYTRRNWFGRGFLEGRVSTEIRDTAVREHTVSALLAGQWGLAGTVGLVLLLLGVVKPAVRPARATGTDTAFRTVRDAAVLFAALLVVAAVLPAPFDLALIALAALVITALAAAPAFGIELLPAAVPEPQPPLSSARLAAELALAVIACTGLYMVLANYGLVFFTGKNVYLLGLDSVGDALEALMLLGLGAAGLALANPVIERAAAATVISLPRRRLRALRAGEPVAMP